MEQIRLKAEIRTELGKSEVKKLHKAGLTPAVYYGEGEKSIHLKLQLRDVHKVLHTSRGENAVINLEISGGHIKNKTVIIKEIQYDPIKDSIRHLDFQHISLTEIIKVKVPIHAKGESPGVKEGGVLEHLFWELEVECLPTQIPERIDVDISKLVIGDSISVKDLTFPPGVKVVHEPEELVIQVVAPKVEVVEEVVPEEEATEPEVIAKERKEEVPEEDPEKKPKKEEKKAKEEGKPGEKPDKE